MKNLVVIVGVCCFGFACGGMDSGDTDSVSSSMEQAGRGGKGGPPPGDECADQYDTCSGQCQRTEFYCQTGCQSQLDGCYACGIECSDDCDVATAACED